MRSCSSTISAICNPYRRSSKCGDYQHLWVLWDVSIKAAQAVLPTPLLLGLTTGKGWLMSDSISQVQTDAENLLRRVQGAIASGIQGAVGCEGSAIRYHEHRGTPDLDWVYAEAYGIAEYITSSHPWRELRTALGVGDAEC